jgi:hypothetical protein
VLEPQGPMFFRHCLSSMAKRSGRLGEPRAGLAEPSSLIGHPPALIDALAP